MLVLGARSQQLCDALLARTLLIARTRQRASTTVHPTAKNPTGRAIKNHVSDLETERLCTVQQTFSKRYFMYTERESSTRKSSNSKRKMGSCSFTTKLMSLKASFELLPTSSSHSRQVFVVASRIDTLLRHICFVAMLWLGCMILLSTCLKVSTLITSKYNCKLIDNRIGLRYY